MSEAIQAIWPRVTNVIGAVFGEMFPPSRQELEERYLNDARDIYDLEYRSRQVDRGIFASTNRFAGDHRLN